jgi:hypothetical protein
MMHPLYLPLTFTLFFSMMDLTGLLSRCQSAIHHGLYFTKIFNKMPSVLVICLCGGMLWQCSTCLLKYFERPIQANVVYSQDFTLAPISITVCNKGTELNYTFPELHSVDIRHSSGEDWITVWAAVSRELQAGTASDYLVFSNSKNRLQLCMSIQVDGSSASDLRIRHHYSDSCKQNKIKGYLHNQGLFNAYDLELEKKFFSSDKNYMLALALETFSSLRTPGFNCSEDNEGQTLDRCLVDEAWKAANKSAGCIFKYFG